MKNIVKRTACAFGAAALSLLLVLPAAAMPNGRQQERNMLPDAVEMPIRRAVREGSEALSDTLDGLLPDPERGTADGGSDGQIGDEATADGSASESMTESASASDSASESATGTGVTNPSKDDNGNMTVLGVIIAIIVVAVIVILIFIAIPKSKAKPGGKNQT